MGWWCWNFARGSGQMLLEDVPELWAGGAGISRAGQAGCCSKTCWNYGPVVLEFRAQVRPNVARGHAGIMGWWCWNFAHRSGQMLREDVLELWAGGARVSHCDLVLYPPLLLRIACPHWCYYQNLPLLSRRLPQLSQWGHAFGAPALF